MSASLWASFSWVSASLAQWIQLVCVKVHCTSKHSVWSQTGSVLLLDKVIPSMMENKACTSGLLSVVPRLGKGSRTFSGNFVLCCYVRDRHRKKGYKWQVFHVHSQHVGQSRAVACTINVYKWKWLTRDERVCVTNITVSAASASPHQEAFSETKAFFVCRFCEFTGTRDLVLSPRNPAAFSCGVNWYGQSIWFPATGETGVPSSLYFTEADDRKPPRQRCSNRNKSSRVRSTSWFSYDLTTVTLTNRTALLFSHSLSH